MENVEILILDVDIRLLNNLMKTEFKIRKEDLKNSHFYNNDEYVDFEYYDDLDLSEYFSTLNTGNIYSSKVFLGDYYKDVLIVISSTDNKADIELSFNEKAFLDIAMDEMINKIYKIISFLINIRKKYFLKSIRIGYEPVTDDDQLLLTICSEGVNICTDLKGELSMILRKKIDLKSLN